MIYLINLNFIFGHFEKECSQLGGKCVTTVDAYYYLVLAFSLAGFLWLLFFSRFVNILNNTPKSDWSLFKKNANGITQLKSSNKEQTRVSTAVTLTQVEPLQVTSF